MYLTLKWLHIVSVISWMCGILYLIRLFIYHSERGRGDQESIHNLLALMEHRLYRYITVPAMAMSWIAGLGIIFTVPAFAQQGWFHIKFILVLCLTALTFKAGKMIRQFSDIRHPVPVGKTLRWLNELPTLLMLVIVALVVFKPFAP